jgi:hypothetical protein
MSAHETYLGDGLFASWDGWQVKLRAPREGGGIATAWHDATRARRLQERHAASRTDP